jgi:hypothetical protein
VPPGEGDTPRLALISRRCTGELRLGLGGARKGDVVGGGEACRIAYIASTIFHSNNENVTVSVTVRQSAHVQN